VGGNIGVREGLDGVERVRGTQSLVHTFGYCWSRPSLLGLELLWRWGFGIPATLLCWYEGTQVFETVRSPLEGTGILNFSLQDPIRAAVIADNAFGVVWPVLLQVLVWLVPLLAVTGSIAAGVGRNLVLRRYDRTLASRPLTLVILKLVRVVMLGVTLVAWFESIRWAAKYSLSGLDAEGEPNLVLYAALVIGLSLGTFSVWSLLSWYFEAAPLIAVAEDVGVGASLKRSLRLGSLTSKLMEVNMVMGIVKLALIVLAMVFSATPLPFASAMTGMPLYLWWAGVSIAYLAASDFFHVARVVSFLQFWRLWHPTTAEHVLSS
jgi:hypothetical protein